MSTFEDDVFSMLIVVLLEHDLAMTLEEVAQELQAAQLLPADDAHHFLTTCRPFRAPVMCRGDRFSVDRRAPELAQILEPPPVLEALVEQREHRAPRAAV